MIILKIQAKHQKLSFRVMLGIWISSFIRLL